MSNLTAPFARPQMGSAPIPSLMGGNIDVSSTYYPGSIVFFRPSTAKYYPTFSAATDIAVGVLQSNEGIIQGSSVTGSLGQQTWIDNVQQGVWLFAVGTGIDAIPITTPPGTPLYCIDNNSVGLDSLGGTRPVAGLLVQVETTAQPGYGGVAGAWVEMRNTIGARVTAPATTPIAPCRNIVTANVADLTAYTVAAANLNDNVSGGNVAGDRVWLTAQTTKSQNGPWIVGTVATGTAPLTRPTDFLPGALVQSGTEVSITEGTVFAKSDWKITTTGGITVDATLFDSYPGRVVVPVTLSSGTIDITSVPILSATKTGFAIVRKTATTSTLTVGGYALNGAATPGILGTATVTVFATVGAGTINNADGSALLVTVINW